MTQYTQEECSIKLENLQFSELHIFMNRMLNNMNWNSCPVRVEDGNLIFTVIEEYYDED